MNRTNEQDTSLHRDHMANERTFLAWIRTSIGIMAFGFVIEKFTLFIKQMSFIVGKATMHLPSSFGYSSVIGILLIGFGTLLSLLAYLKFRKVQRQIDQRHWQRASLLDLLLTLVIFLMGLFLMVYLVKSTASSAIPS